MFSNLKMGNEANDHSFRGRILDCEWFNFCYSFVDEERENTRANFIFIVACRWLFSRCRIAKRLRIWQLFSHRIIWQKYYWYLARTHFPSCRMRKKRKRERKTLPPFFSPREGQMLNCEHCKVKRNKFNWVATLNTRSIQFSLCFAPPLNAVIS